MARIVTLTTDFGTRDSYVAEMKARILSAVSAVHLVDVTHEIAPQDVLGGAVVLEAVAASFPAGTIHLGVVDPGVGTARRGLVVAARGQFFVGPDNGLFTAVLEGGPWRAFELRGPGGQGTTPGRTFHGRDVFAPAAARLALGTPPGRLGPGATDPVRLDWPRSRVEPRGVTGHVLHVDRFGNLVTTIDATQVEALGTPVAVRIGTRRLPVVGTYGDLPPGGAGGLLGSSRRLEVAVRDGNAARRFGARRGTEVRLSRTRRRPGSRSSRPAPSSGTSSRC